MRLREFTTVWWSDWLGRMSGPLTVPFATAALYVSSHWQRVSYGVLAALCVIVTSYRVWLVERIALETEKAKHQIDDLAATIAEYARSQKPDRMNAPILAVKEAELASYFNETRERIFQALLLLENQGRTKRLRFPEHWGF